MFEFVTLAPSGAPRQLSPDTEVDVALLRDPGDRLAPASDLLRSPAFFRLHAASFSRAWYAVVMDGSTGDSIAGGWFAETTPGVAHSGARGPFGAVHSPFAPLPLALAERIVRATEEELRVRDIREVHVTLPPSAYEPESHAEWMNVYLRLGYENSVPDLAFHVDVGPVELLERMSAVRRAIVATAPRRGLSVRSLLPNERADAHTVIAAGRGAPCAYGLSLESLLALDTALPGVLQWHGVFHRERLVAAAVSASLSDDQCGVIAFGDMGGGEHDAPRSVLLAELHAWCAARGQRRLHVGNASADGIPNGRDAALFRQLGFETSAQYSLGKVLRS